MPDYFYSYACHEEEEELCALELRSLFGVTAVDSGFVSSIDIDPSRSPFLKLQMKVEAEAGSLEELAEAASEAIELNGTTFKVVFVVTDEDVPYAERRAIERVIGASIRGVAEMRQPGRTLFAACVKGRWLLGSGRYNVAVWLRNSAKPQNYSTALSTRVARALTNIAVPDPAGRRVIDPCCGIGTVLVEALSMGMDIVGFDINPLAVRGARVNLAHFGYADVVTLSDMRSLSGHYDAAILDMPYNLCSVVTDDEQLEMLESVRRLASRVVVVSTVDLDPLLAQAGLSIVDGCEIRKGRFTRLVRVCN